MLESFYNIPHFFCGYGTHSIGNIKCDINIICDVNIIQCDVCTI